MARLGLPEIGGRSLLADWNQAWVVENPYGQVDAVLGRILGLKLVGGQSGTDDAHPWPARWPVMRRLVRRRRQRRARSSWC